MERYVHAVIPPRVDYKLSDLGSSLMPTFDQMAAWGLGYQKRKEPRRANAVSTALLQDIL